ncbi:hypothetical protein F5Y14DRAFT_405013 [Nemania sp. NC0429]|nr:hypothetical protein F5Y14DRAFT_405013 [Nemania sp. NC0429]
MPLSRKKSCARCRASKLRCNLGTPCSQCAKKRLRCTYDGRDADRVLPYSHHGYGQPSTSTSTSTSTLPRSTPTQSVVINDVDISSLSHDGVDGSLMDFSGASGSPFESEDFGRTPYISLAMPKSFVVEAPTHTAFPELDSFNLFEAHADADAEQPAQTIHPTSSCSGPSPCPSDDFRIVPLQEKATTLRRRGLLHGCVLTSVALGQLKAFPKMMLEGDNLPPFIQPPCRADDELALQCRVAGRHKCLPEILAVSATLVDMFCSRTPANEEFVWKMIYTEAARLREHFHRFDRDQQLAAIQAITVYVLLQADDLKSVEKNDVATLLMTSMEFIMIMSNACTGNMNMSRIRPTRQQWVFQESLRRILTIFCIIDLLLEGMKEPDGYHCDNNGGAFRVNALPCQRDIWEARSVRAWILHYDQYLATRDSDETLTGAHLVESQLSITSPAAAHDAPKPDVMRWCEGLDMLGTLVWMIVPLYQYRVQQTRGKMVYNN